MKEMTGKQFYVKLLLFDVFTQPQVWYSSIKVMTKMGRPNSYK